MLDIPDFEFSDEKNDSAQFFAWQVCLADEASHSLSDADDYPGYLINREPITQMLGIGMASGQNAYTLDNQLFVCAISIQEPDGTIKLIDPSYPHYSEVAQKASEELLNGQDRGMVALLPNGSIIAVKNPVDPSTL